MKPTKPLVIGVVGGSGTGKSHFSRLISQRLSAALIEGDVIGHEALEMPALKEAITKTFGEDVLENGSVDRNKLGHLVFNDSNQLKRLNEIMHPEMYNRIKGLISRVRQSVVVLDAAVMIEAGFYKLVDLMVHLKADESVRIQRLIEKRGVDEDRAAAMVRLGRSDYADYSHMWIDTTYGIESIEEEIGRYFDGLIGGKE